MLRRSFASGLKQHASWGAQYPSPSGLQPSPNTVADPKIKHQQTPTPPAGVDFLRSTLTAPATAADVALRPLSFSDFAGQSKTVERLKVMVGAARRRNEALNHILLSGPPGLGKTTLAFILGAEMGRNVRVT